MNLASTLSIEPQSRPQSMLLQGFLASSTGTAQIGVGSRVFACWHNPMCAVLCCAVLCCAVLCCAVLLQ
jgi:hypothetical protein